MDKDRILVAGATGTNGRELVRELVHAGVATRALVRDADRAADLAGEYVELAVGDLDDRASLQRAFDGVRKAYVVTAVGPQTERWFDNFYAAAQAAGVEHVVKFSGLGADTASPSEIIRQHARSDAALIASGLAYTILRPNSFYQNMLWQADAIRATGAFYLAVGDARQSQVDVRDLAAATRRILTEPGHDNRIYELTGPESLSYFDVAETLSGVLGRPVTYVPVAVDAVEAAMREAGMPEWEARAVAEIQGAFSSGAYAAPTDDLATLLGQPPRRFADFAKDFAAAFGGAPA